MEKTYAVIGAGMQGIAAAYDLYHFGNAKRILMADLYSPTVKSAVSKLNKMAGTNIFEAFHVDVQNKNSAVKFLKGVDVCLSAVPYFFNADLTQCAIEAGTNFCDLGGNTEVVFRQHEKSEDAKKAGITIAPDCGLAPGMCNILAAHGIKQMEDAKKVHIRVGGLPKNPQPPLGYHLYFSMEGLTNEYFGKAHVLKNGKRVEVDTFTELEEIDFPEPYGKCEAFMTSGGTSTSPWTFEGVLEEFDEKTIRYPGHYEKMKTIHELGLLDLNPVKVNDKYVIPRQLFHAVVEPILRAGDPKDVVLLRVTITGDEKKLVLELIDHFDEKTGFTAMQRTTGWGATIVAIMIAKGELPTGSIRLEQAVDTQKYIDEMHKRGLNLNVY